jgi:hypothetical protein
LHERTPTAGNCSILNASQAETFQWRRDATFN